MLLLPFLLLFLSLSGVRTHVTVCGSPPVGHLQRISEPIDSRGSSVVSPLVQPSAGAFLSVSWPRLGSEFHPLASFFRCDCLFEDSGKASADVIHAIELSC